MKRSIGGNAMNMKILWAGVFLVLGWFGCYLFGRQLIFNLRVAFPTIKKMNKTDPDLIAIGADKYTKVSMAVCIIVIAIAAFVVIRFCKLYGIICFFAGAVVALFMLVPTIKPENRAMFESFCMTYYRFVPDDELRTAMYNKKFSKMKLRLYDMNLSTEFIPAFKNN